MALHFFLWKTRHVEDDQVHLCDLRTHHYRRHACGSCRRHHRDRHQSDDQLKPDDQRSVAHDSGRQGRIRLRVGKWARCLPLIEARRHLKKARPLLMGVRSDGVMLQCNIMSIMRTPKKAAKPARGSAEDVIFSPSKVFTAKIYAPCTQTFLPFTAKIHAPCTQTFVPCHAPESDISSRPDSCSRMRSAPARPTSSPT